MPKKKWGKEVKAKAIARLTLGETAESIAKDLVIPSGTVRFWKMNLQKVQDEGELGYHFEETIKFVRRAWRIAHRELEMAEESLKNMKVTTPKELRDLTVSLGILYDKISKALPQFKPAGETPLDLSKITTARLRLIIAELETKGVDLIAKMGKEVAKGEIIEGESREITEEEK